MKKAIILLSGGIDSAVSLYLAKQLNYYCYCLIFDYNQRHRKEIISAKKIAIAANSKYKLIKFSLPWCKNITALVDKKISLPKDRIIINNNNIPVTYVPGRNTIFISFGLSFAEVVGADSIFIGAHVMDYSGYPDCRADYYKVVNRLAQLGTKCGIEGRIVSIQTPLLDKTKAEIIKLGSQLGVPFELTWSCYEGSDKQCNRCDSCILRAKGFRGAGLFDPLCI